MTALNAFLFGMPAVLIAGSLVTLYFARRAANDIASHAPKPKPVVQVAPGSVVTQFRRPDREPFSGGTA